MSALIALSRVAALVSTRSVYSHVFDIYAPVAIGVFVVVAVATIGAVLWFRRRPPERAARWHEHNRLEGAYVLLLACVVAFLLYVTFGAEHKVDTVAARERPGLIVVVTGAKWEWRFSYPGYGIERYSGAVGHQSLVVPINTAILFRLRSIDVIHEFWVPELDFKRALIPGGTNTAVLTFTRAGHFAGQCDEFCGLLHYAMTVTVDAVSPAAFRLWLRAQQAHRSSAPSSVPHPYTGSAA